MKKVFVFSVFILLLFSCATNRIAKTPLKDFEKIKGKVHIPFTLNDYMPMFTVVVDDVELNLDFDSGCNFNQITKRGSKKLNPNQKEVLKDFEEYFREEDSSKSEKEIKQLAKNAYKTGYTMYGRNTRVVDYKLGDVEFQYNPSAALASKKSDGTVGISFFGDIDNIVIDYVHKEIILNAEKIYDNAIPMRKENLGLYFIDIEIDGIKQTALVDTGAEVFFTRNDYQRLESMSADEKLEFIKNNEIKIPRTAPKVTKLHVKYGSKLKEVKGYACTNILARSSDVAKRLSYIYNLFGYPMYKDAIIQFDLKRMEFSIRE